jgi:hypothetical protein
MAILVVLLDVITHEIHAMQPHRLSVKFFLKPPARIEHDKLIPMFHRWIQNQLPMDGLAVDVADYGHVADGPGVMLIGHEFDYALDSTDGRPGLLYVRKRDAQAPLADRLRRAIAAAALGCKRIQDDPSPHGSLCFDGSTIELRFIDQLRAPNTQAAFDQIRSTIESLAREWFGSAAKVARVPHDPRTPLTIHIIATGVSDPARLADHATAGSR